MKRLIAAILSVVAYPATEANEQQVQELLSKMTLEWSGTLMPTS